MRAIRIVQTLVGDQQVVQDLASQDRLGHDPGHVIDGDPSVPDPLRINDDGRSVLALLQASRMIRTGQRAEPGVFQFFLEGFAQRLIPLQSAMGRNTSCIMTTGGFRQRRIS